MSKLKQPRPFYHDSTKTPSLGCVGCPELSLCGGLQTIAGSFNCMDFCKQCTAPEECNFVCRKYPSLFIDRCKEVRGFSFDSIPVGNNIEYKSFPMLVPEIYHGFRRVNNLSTKAVAVPLKLLFDHQTGKIKFHTREDVARYFRFDPKSLLLIDSVSEDREIELYWSIARQEHITEKLLAIQPDLVTVPNFSVFLKVPRWDNLHNMKRIAICWYELTSKGLPTSLHINARAERDWKRWADFIQQHKEVQSICYEFATGANIRKRGKEHVKQLMDIAVKAGRKLQLIMRGGKYYIKELKQVFSEIVFIDTTSFMKAVARQKASSVKGQKIEWDKVSTLENQPIDEILEHNILTTSKMISEFI